MSAVKQMAIAICVILTASCASNSHIDAQPSQDKSPESTDTKSNATKPSCESLVRNLTLPWQPSQTRCYAAKIETSPLVDDVNKRREMQILESRRKRNAYLARKRKEREQLAVMYVAEELLNQSSGTEFINKGETSRNKKSRASVAHKKISNHIWFAKNIRILGPHGSAATLALVPNLKASNDRILLRGFYLEDELDGFDREVFSVARALAVKKKLVDEGGINPERITILHHSPDINARYVEVNING